MSVSPSNWEFRQRRTQYELRIRKGAGRRVFTANSELKTTKWNEGRDKTYNRNFSGDYD